MQTYVQVFDEERALPRFDNHQTPLLELQLDKEGDLHFLQYLKTGHRLEVPWIGVTDRAASASHNEQGERKGAKKEWSTHLLLVDPV